MSALKEQMNAGLMCCAARSRRRWPNPSTLHVGMEEVPDNPIRVLHSNPVENGEVYDDTIPENRCNL